MNNNAATEQKLSDLYNVPFSPGPPEVSPSEPGADIPLVLAPAPPEPVKQY